MDGESNDEIENDELNAENSIEIEDDELIRYNGGPIDLIEDNVDLRIEFDQPMFDIENDNNETTTKESDNDGTANNIDYNGENSEAESDDNADSPKEITTSEDDGDTDEEEN